MSTFMKNERESQDKMEKGKNRGDGKESRLVQGEKGENIRIWERSVW